MAAKLRITFVCPLLRLNGGHRVVATYARLLQARGHDVTIISQAPRRPTLRARVKHLLRRDRLKAFVPMPLDAAVRHIRLAHPPTPADVPDGDVIIATWWQTAEWVAALPASKGRKVHLLQDYEVFPHLPRDRVIATYRLPLHRIAVSGYIAGEIARQHGVTGIDLVMNGVDHAQFTAPPRTRRTPPAVGFLYTASLRKNVALAIAAVTAARAQNPDLRVVAFGSAPVSPALPLPGWITYHQTPAQGDIPQIYAACDAWLFTSHNEGFGLPILEAMACRTPVLATRAGAAPDLIDGVNGRLLAADAAVFADAIHTLTTQPAAQWQTASDAAWHTAAAHGWDAATDRLLAVLTGADHTASPTHPGPPGPPAPSMPPAPQAVS